MKTNILLLAALLGTSLVYAQHTKIVNTVQNSNTKDDHTSITTDWKGARYQIEMVDDKLTELTVDGKKIPAAEWGNYDAVIKEIMVQVEKDRAQAEKDRIQADKDRAQADRDREHAMKDRVRSELDREQAMKDKVQAEKDRELAHRDRTHANQARSQASQARAQAERDREQAARDRGQAERDREQAAKDRLQAQKDRAEAAEDRKQMKAMVSELVSDKIIPDEKSLNDLTFTSDAMTVNGKKMDDATFKKYKTKYSRFSGKNFYYNCHGESTHMGSYEK